MDAERWSRAKDLFQEALEREPGQREAFLREACNDDASLRETVAEMLAHHPAAVELFRAPALLAEINSLARDLDDAGGAHAEHVAAPIPPLQAQPVPVRRARFPPWWIWLLALVFMADVLLRAYCRNFGPEGFGFEMQAQGGRYVVVGVDPGGLAETAGLQRGDVVVSRDAVPIEFVARARVDLANLEVGRRYRFDIERQDRPMAVTLEMRRKPARGIWENEILTLWQVGELLMFAMACLIAYMRPYDPAARLGALALATLSVSLWVFNFPPGYAAIWRGLPVMVGAWLWIPNLCVSLVGPIGLSFFASFPRALFQRRWPWIFIWLPALCLMPWSLRFAFLTVYEPDVAHVQFLPDWFRQARTATFGFYGLAMVGALTANYLRLTDINEKRRLRVLIAGGAAGTIPGLARSVVRGSAPGSALNEFLMGGWRDVAIAALFLLFPLSFAYAVLRHRLLGIRVIVRKGVQYALARGTALALVPAIGLAMGVDALVHSSEPLIGILRMRGWIYAGLAVLAVAVHTQRRRWRDAIDRRFFREHYDAGRLLRDVAAQARHAGSLEHAAPAVVAHLEAALHPEFAAILFKPTGDTAFRCIASSPSGQAPLTIDADGPLVALLRGSEKPLDLTSRRTDWLEQHLEAHEIERLRLARIDLAVPIAMGPGSCEALLALGARRSEEPYTSEDLDPLEAIASSLWLLLDHSTPRPDHLTSAFAECPRCGTCYDTGSTACDKERTPLVQVNMPRVLAGRYRLEQRLGRGGMGKVYEAVDSALGRRVAVKVIRDEWVHSAQAAQRFRQEVRAVAGLAHPNVVTVHDYGVEAGTRAFLVMELLNGLTLRDELRRTGRLPAARVVEVFRGVCSGVDAAHRRKLVHRDLKPENIFLVRAADGDDGTVKLLDFGVAKALPAPGESAPPESEAFTDAGVLVGTVGYMSPEQLLGERPDVSWDLWALAIVAYEAVTGALPFPVSSRTVWRQSVLDGRFTSLREHIPDAPAAWRDFFTGALAVERTRRSASAAVFFRQLEQALRHGSGSGLGTHRT